MRNEIPTGGTIRLPEPPVPDRALDTNSIREVTGWLLRERNSVLIEKRGAYYLYDATTEGGPMMERVPRRVVRALYRQHKVCPLHVATADDGPSLPFDEAETDAAIPEPSWDSDTVVTQEV